MKGIDQIKELERIYEDSPREIRDHILSRVLEIKTETGFGCMMAIPTHYRGRRI